MELPRRTRLQHIPPAFVPEGSWYFLTICCQRRGENQLCLSSIAPLLLDDATAYHRHRRWHLHLFLLMPDHLHAIAGFPAGERMAAVVRDWKRLTARRSGVAWQRGFFDHRLRPGENLELKSRYVRENPIRAGLIQTPEAWPYFIDHRTVALR